MANSNKLKETITDITLLYELSLAIGRSLDLKTNCAEFLRALMARKNLSFTSIWIKNKYLPEEESNKGASLVYALPDYRTRENSLSLNHPLFRYLYRKKFISLTSSDANYKKVITEKGIRSGTFAVFSLNELGVMKLFSSTRKERCDDKELNQLGKVIAKFAVSLEGCLAYRQSQRELSERKRMEEKLRKERDFNRSLLQASPIFFVAINGEGQTLMMNEMLLTTLGYKKEEVVGKDYLKTFAPKSDWEKIKNVYNLLINQHQPTLNQSHILTKDGRELLVEWHGMPMFKKNGEFDFFFGVGIDITNRHRIEEELLKSSKLESLGIMAGGIAHDFNNILTGILGNITLARLELAPKSRAVDRLREAEKATTRAKNLTQQLLTFSRGGRPIKISAALEDFMPEAIDFALSGSNVTYILSLPKDLWPVFADVGQIGQVIDNIVINAAQSMPEGGSITVKAENIKIDNRTPLRLKKGKYVKISVNDSGIGIAEKHLSKIFDPFFTTKQKGSGLGLTSAYSIIKKHRGIITVDSQVSQGTTFSVYIPVADHPAIKKESIERKKIIKRKGRILIIDDEEIVRDVADRFVKFLGYQTDMATSGKKGILLYKKALKSGRPYDAVILDLTMPGGMGGKEVAKKIRAVNRYAKIIASSGYSTDPIISHYKKFGFAGALIKPYRIDELIKILESVTGENP